MRRIIETLPGKAICRFAVTALTVSTLMLTVTAKASAQLTQKPSWAVVDFVSRASGESASTLGRVAGEAFANELGKTNKYDVIPEETVRNTVDQLKLVQPITSKVSLLRLGQELQASSIVTGEVLNYRIVTNGNSRHADVILKSVVTDVASGLPVNGDALAASSAERDKAVTIDELLGEAISQGAATMVSDISQTSLPTATVLNTYEKTAMINQGSRTGFKIGQQVVILRGREQVAFARVAEIETSSATVSVTSSKRGIQPGDRVRAIFQAPDIADTFPSNGGQPKVHVAKSKGSNANVIQLLLLVGLVAFLFGNGRGSSTDLIHNVDVEAGMFVGTSPESAAGGGVAGVRVSYSPDQFISGNRKFVQYQGYKLPSADILPSMVAPNQTRTMVETVATPVAINVIDTSAMTAPSGSTCDVTAVTYTSFTPTTQLTVGTSYQYQVELVYRLSYLDLPVPPTSGGDCYFVTPKATSTGYATPLNRPSLTYPAKDATVPTSTFAFRFNSVLSGSINFTADYAVEVCSDSTFASGKTAVVAQLTRSSTGNITTGQVDLTPTSTSIPAVIRSSSEVWWRVGARNAGDNPGPIADSLGQRYIWSLPQRMVRGTTSSAGVKK